MAEVRLRGMRWAGLRAQLTKSADSVAATIVEGCGADTNPEFARFLGISIKSGAETEYHLQKAHDLRTLPDREWRALTTETMEIRMMTYAYRKKVLDDEN
jgi:four helix bundle protein